MSSAQNDLTTEARIRLAALDLFGQHGTEAVSVRAVAQEVGVSPALVMHHFGSKAGLIAAVDDHLVARVTQYLDEFTKSGDEGQARSNLTAISREPELFAYLGRCMAEGSASGADLFDRLLAMANDVIDTMTEAGIVRAVPDQAAVAILLLVNDLGLMLLRPHVIRALGVDPFSPEGQTRLGTADIDLKTRPLFIFPEQGEHP